MKRPTRQSLEDEVDCIPLKNLPMSGLTAYPIRASEDGSVPADNVLTGAFGQLAKVSLVGVTAEGEYYFASSVDDETEIYSDLAKFANLLKDYTE